MRMNDLIRYDVPAEIIQLWKERESTSLLPLQEAAVKRFDALGAGNLLIQAPTSSGKTFVGEMAAVRAALRRKKAVYLVPLKALAEEKYRDFREKYEAYGIKVAISTRDHRDHDRDIEAGDFAIAVVVYEKLAQLLVRRPEHLQEIELIVADELEILSDPERGAAIELLLTRIVRSSCRLIGLSAVVGEADRLAQWMNARLLAHERRPVELRFGVLHEGRFHYRTYNEAGEGHEDWLDAGADTPWEMLTRNLLEMAGRGESCMVFVKAKHEARRGAEVLAAEFSGDPAAETIATLVPLEPTTTRELLLRTLESGIAFHSADLSPDERRAVEAGFRAGEIRILVSTSTLAVGLNLPAQNVFISADKWRFDERFGMPWKAPILRSEFENMGGRAGRYGAEHPFGRSILVASSAFEREALWRRYVEGEREAIRPRLDNDPLENHILYLVASACCRDESDLIDFLESTPTGQWLWPERYPVEEIECRIRAAVHRAVDAGVLQYDDASRLEVTPFGRAVAAKGVRIETAQMLERWVRAGEDREWPPLDALLAAALTPDGRTYAMSLTAAEYEHAAYPERLRRAAGRIPLHGESPLARLRQSSVTPFFEEIRSIKIALALDAWIEQHPILEIEEEFCTTVGQVLASADQIAWLLDAAAAIASAQGASAAAAERLCMLAQRVQRGLRAEALPLARVGKPGLSRSAIAALVAWGWHTPEALAQLEPRALTSLLPREEAIGLIAWAQSKITRTASAEPQPESPEPAFVVDDARPDCILVDGHVVPLQEKQFRLARLLAERPGVCIAYDEVYDSLWGNAIVESSQLHFQKNRLLARIRDVLPERARIVRTVPKRGFCLDLEPHAVEIRAAQPPRARTGRVAAATAG
jgi:helicase